MIPDEVGPALDLAVLGVLDAFGSERDLAALQWSITVYPDVSVIEGRPRADTTDPVAAARSWAAALGMVEYAWDEESRPAWHTQQGHWHFEVTSRRD